MMINQVIQINEDIYRILAFKDDKVALFSMQSNFFNITIKHKIELELLEEKGVLKVSQDPYSELREKNYSTKIENIVNEKFKLIKDIVYNKDLLFNRKLLLDVISNLCVDDPKRSRERKIKRALHDWWLKGQSLGALNPDYGKNIGMREWQNKPGRKNQHNSDEGTSINNELRDKFDIYIKKYVLKENGDSLKTAYQIFLYDFLKENPDVNCSNAPSFYQFRFFYRQKYNIRDKSKALNNTIIYNKDIRPIIGSSQDIALGAGSIYQIDSTLADVELVSELDSSRSVGRPTLYIVRDVFSSMIVGLSVSLDPAMYKTAADALYVSIINKVKYCKSFGIEIKESDWPAQGIPACILADNGELSGKQIEIFARSHNVRIDITAPYRADQKGIVEETFNVLQNSIKSIMTSVPNKQKLHKAGYKETRHLATLNIKEYTKMLILGVISVNTHTHKNIPAGFDPNIAPNTLNLWNWSIKNNLSQIRYVEDEMLLRLMLLPRFDYTISQNGINVSSIYYFCEEAANTGMFDRSIKEERPKDMQIAIDPANISNAWLFPNPMKQPFYYLKCRLAPKSQYLSGMTMYEAKKYISDLSRSINQSEKESDFIRGEIRKKQEEIAEAAKKNKVKSKDSISKQIKSIKQNREQERIIQEANSPRINIIEDNDNNESLEKNKEYFSDRKRFQYPTRFEDIPD